MTKTQKAQHTAGEWSYSKRNETSIRTCFDISAKGVPVSIAKIYADHYRLADKTPLDPIGEAEANACLISSAPSLFSALVELQSFILEGNTTDRKLVAEYCHLAQQAIAKAKGK